MEPLPGGPAFGGQLPRFAAQSGRLPPGFWAGCMVAWPSDAQRDSAPHVPSPFRSAPTWPIGAMYRAGGVAAWRGLLRPRRLGVVEAQAAPQARTPCTAHFLPSPLFFSTLRRRSYSLCASPLVGLCLQPRLRHVGVKKNDGVTLDLVCPNARLPGLVAVHACAHASLAHPHAISRCASFPRCKAP